MKSVKYEQENEDKEDGGMFNHSNTGLNSNGDDREKFKQQTIANKRLKFDTIPIKTVIEVRKNAIHDNLRVQTEESSGLEYVKENNGFVEITSPNKLNKIKLK